MRRLSPFLMLPLMLVAPACADASHPPSRGSDAFDAPRFHVVRPGASSSYYPYGYSPYVGYYSPHHYPPSYYQSYPHSRHFHRFKRHHRHHADSWRHARRDWGRHPRHRHGRHR